MYRRRVSAVGGGASIRGAVARFVLAGLAAVAVLVVGGVLVARPIAERQAVDEARRLTTLAGRGIVEPALTDAALAGRPVALTRLDRVVQERVLDDEVVRVKIWTPTGRIAYSDEPRLIGDRYGLGSDQRDALRTGATRAEVSDLDEPENAFERDEGSLLEVYLPIRTPTGGLALFETYRRAGAIEASGRDFLRAFAPVIGAALLLLWLVQVPLAWSMARRLGQGLRERQALLETAAEASALERRRVAADLHDGPLQDLAGLAFALAGAAGRAPEGTDPATVAALRDGADAAREATRRLRAAVVDINPGRLRDQGLGAALSDLAAPLRARGVEVEVAVPDALELAPRGEELLYRAAAEGLRNVAAHAGARRVTVRVRAEGGRAHLRLEDDGRGFEPATRARRRAEGHVGLELVEELARHLGGRAEVRSAPGKGTVLEVEVPA